ncbi:hypothetical protein ACHWQZ_G014298 [Mnemiopsis leidyi]
MDNNHGEFPAIQAINGTLNNDDTAAREEDDLLCHFIALRLLHIAARIDRDLELRARREREGQTRALFRWVASVVGWVVEVVYRY